MIFQALLEMLIFYELLKRVAIVLLFGWHNCRCLVVAAYEMLVVIEEHHHTV